jgi:hypothetical protein
MVSRRLATLERELERIVDEIRELNRQLSRAPRGMPGGRGMPPMRGPRAEGRDDDDSRPDRGGGGDDEKREDREERSGN